MHVIVCNFADVHVCRIGCVCRECSESLCLRLKESEEHMNLCAYLIKDKFIHVYLLKGVVLSAVWACDSSQSRCEPPSQSEAPPERLEVPKEEMVQ